MDPSPLTDHQLLEDYLSNHAQNAFSELVRRHLNLVYYTALRRVGGDAHLAEDVAQSVFIALAQKAAEAKARPVLAGWLYRSTRFAAAQAVRTEKRRQHREQEAYTMELLNAPVQADWQKLGPVLVDALDDLAERDREIMLLRFFENRPLAEVGARFALSADAARMRIDRALEKLRSSLAKRGVASTAAAVATVLVAQSSQAAPLGLAGKVTTGVFSGAPAAFPASAGLAAALTATAWKIAAAIVLAALGTSAVVYRISKPPSEPRASAMAVSIAPAPALESPKTIPAAQTSQLQPASAIGSSQFNWRVQRLDDLVHLSSSQKTQAAGIFSVEDQALSQLDAGKELVIKGSPIRSESRAQIAAMLTDSQRVIYNQTPLLSGMRVELIS